MYQCKIIKSIYFNQKRHTILFPSYVQYDRDETRKIKITNFKM
jgi:hypothetical protein